MTKTRDFRAACAFGGRSGVLIVLGLAAAAVGAGCGATTTVETVGTKSGPGTPTATASQQTEAGHTSPGGGAPNGEVVGAVPDEVHRTLVVAEGDLGRQGVPYRVVVSSGKIPSGTLTVCAMNPAPRTHLESGTAVRLIVGRTCPGGKE
jgi:hypothetical protein